MAGKSSADGMLQEKVSPPPKDEEELELERLVFGDAEGFVANLKKIDNLYDYSEEEEEDYDGTDGLLDTSGDESDLDGVQDEDLFTIDDGHPDHEDDDDAMDVDEEDQEQEEDDESDIDEDAAWVDSDDEKLNISLLASDRIKKLRKTETDSVISGHSYVQRLRSQFEKIYPRPDWVDKLEQGVDAEAEEGSDDEMAGDDEDETANSSINGDASALMALLSSTKPLIITKQLKLISPHKISVTRLKNANHVQPSKGAIQSLSFHPTHPLLMTGGFDRTLRVYHIDGKTNNVVTSLHLRNSPITTCAFAPTNSNSNLIFAAGRRRYMTKWDLDSGEVEKISRMYGHEQFQRSFEYFKVSPRGSYIGLVGSSGWCNILNGKTGQWVRGFKVEGTIVDFEFTFDESVLIVVNTAGEVWEFSMSGQVSKKSTNNKHNNNGSSNLIRRWQDDSAIGITKLKLGGAKSRWLAIGTNNGIVNVYDRNSESTKPLKCVENLVTTISSLSFSPDGQLLAIASRAKKDALRLVHIPSCSVYSNWPTSGTPLGRVTAVSFSPNNEMLAIGNDSGKVTLWRMNHY
ncbi:U3 small nucleolar RNA-associated protein 18 [[Candida] anglica]|uniref:U3 small nucleolar RNA-associated protein 18 n=1 Tax=[Candida] anglica TaxID=148631 RepID=A0ABP0EBQ9_9ASCO